MDPDEEQDGTPRSAAAGAHPAGRSDSTATSGSAVSRAEKKAQSRRQILDAARDVFFRDGFMSANLDEAAEKAGVAKGTLYRYFESKADLYVAVLADNGQVFTERMKDEAASGEFAIDQIRQISQFYYEYWVRHPEYFQIFWAIDNQAVIGELPGAVVDEVARLWEQSLTTLQVVLTRAIDEGDLVQCDTWEVANILWTTANALIQSDATRARRELRRLPLERVFHDAIRLLLLGLATPESRLRE
jgi:AcrR family transcriptional regulator